MEEKCCCSNEPIGTIPIMRIIEKLDELFSRNDLQGAGRVLEYWEKEARALSDRRGLCEILSEEIGYFRRTGERDKGLAAVDEALKLLNCLDNECVSSATIYLNCATTMKAFGQAQEALPYYLKAKEIYERLLPADDYRLAGLYNNYATALTDVKDYKGAQEYYDKAIDLLKAKGGYGELAVSYVNLAHMIFDESQQVGQYRDDEIDRLLQLAYDCLDDENLARDGNYAFICSKCAPAYKFFGHFIEGGELEERAKRIYENN